MSSIADLLNKIEMHERRQDDVPIEAAQSYPFLAMCQQQLCVAVFYFVVTGQPRQRSSFPPRWLAAIPVDHGEVIEFRHLLHEDLANEVLGFDDDDEPVHVQTGAPRMSYGDLVQKEAQLNDALQLLIPLFKRRSREPVPASKIYLERLKELVPLQWRGYYLAIGRQFFLWLMQTSGGIRLIDPPTGAPTSPPR